MIKRILLAALVVVAHVPLSASAETILALRDADQPYLISFDSDAPQTITGQLTISGLPTLPVKAKPVAVEFRPSGGVYLLVKNLPTDTDCAVYVVSTISGQATPIASSTFNCTAVVGDADMDPRVDYLRIVSGTDNYRYGLTSSTKFAGTAVAYKVGDTHEGATPDIKAVAYDQNVSGTTNTSLFALDAGTDSLVLVGGVDASVGVQDQGELYTVGALTEGGVAVPFTSAAFDISGASTKAFVFLRDAAATPSNKGFYAVDLSGGTAGNLTFVGKVGDGSATILSMTAVPATIFLPPPAQQSSIDLEGGALPWSLLGLLAALGLWRRRLA